MNEREKILGIVQKHPAWSEHGEVAPRVNERGAMIHQGSWDGSRYAFDSRLASAFGWQQYDTDQDAWYFGIWVHVRERLVFTYAEGDLLLVTCETEEIFQAELAHMAEFYGAPPPAMVVLDLSAGTETRVYDEGALFGRPMPEGGQTVQEASKG